MKLFYQAAAKNHFEALPIGNGRMGVMFFGDVYEDKISLNEDTFWSGYPRYTGVDNAADRFLPELRRQILHEKDYYRAEELAERMQGPFNESYLPIGDLKLQIGHKGTFNNYRRELDIVRGVGNVQYALEDVHYTRSYFVSEPDNLVVIHFTADKGEAISFSGCIDSFIHHDTHGFSHRYAMKGRAPRHVDPVYVETSNKVTDHPIVYDEPWEKEKGMLFEAHLQIVNQGGKVRCDGNGFSVTAADAVTLLIYMGTSFVDYKTDPSVERQDIEGKAEEVFAAAMQYSYADLEIRHKNEHSAWMDRVDFALSGNTEQEKLPTDERLKQFEDDRSDLGLIPLIYQYGRYLLLASSRPGTQPANLQGIWNWQVRPAWSCNYTLNCNAQINYWFAETANLSELHKPFLLFLKEIADTGAKTAENLYHARGWCAHHNVDLWRATAPIGRGESDSKWSMYPMAGHWICQHLWEHYLFTLDKDFLREYAYPILRAACQFMLDFMVVHPDGYLTTCPSSSPEGRFTLENGATFSVGDGSTHDYHILSDLIACTTEAAEILGGDEAFIAEVKQARDNFPNIFPLDERGCLRPWQVKTVKGSGMDNYSVYPGRTIRYYGTPEHIDMILKSWEHKRSLPSKKHVAFMEPWNAGVFARLHQTKEAKEYAEFTLYACLFPNMLGMNSPQIFQIDTNFAETASIGEMLLQSHDGAIDLLPALPKEWGNGHIFGIKARGGYTVEIAWEESMLSKAEIIAQHDGECAVRPNCKVTVETATGEKVATKECNGIYTFYAAACETYKLIPNS